MGKRILLGVLITALVLFLGVPGFAQESTVKGNLAGVVIDASGAINSDPDRADRHSHRKN